MKLLYASAKALQAQPKFHRKTINIQKSKEGMSQQFDPRRYAIGLVLSDSIMEKQFNQPEIKIYSGLHFLACGYQATRGQLLKMSKSNEREQTISPLFLDDKQFNLNHASFEMGCRIEIIWRTFSCFDFDRENTSLGFPTFPNKFSIWACDPYSSSWNDQINASASLELICKSPQELVAELFNNNNFNSPIPTYCKKT